MDTIEAFGWVTVSCVVVLLIVLRKRRAQLILGFFARMILGTFCIIYANDLLAAQGIPLAVGINPISLLTTGSLGFGGVALLYGILALKFL